MKTQCNIVVIKSPTIDDGSKNSHALKVRVTNCLVKNQTSKTMYIKKQVCNNMS